MAVKTNQEYHAVQNEIAFAQTEIKTLEDKMLERMLEADDLTAALKKAEARARGGDRRRSTPTARRMAAEHAELKASLERIAGERAALVARARPAGAARRSSASRSAATASPSPRRATASARSATCACGRRCSTPSAATKQIIQCDSCNRILYFVPGRAAARRRRRQPTS